MWPPAPGLSCATHPDEKLDFEHTLTSNLLHVTRDSERLSIAQMSKATGMTAHTLRYYERAELIRRVARDSRNQRQYSVADVEWGNFLSRLRETGMPIAQMREYAALRERGLATTAQRQRLLEAHRANLHE